MRVQGRAFTSACPCMKTTTDSPRSRIALQPSPRGDRVSRPRRQSHLDGAAAPAPGGPQSKTSHTQLRNADGGGRPHGAPVVPMSVAGAQPRATMAHSSANTGDITGPLRLAAGDQVQPEPEQGKPSFDGRAGCLGPPRHRAGPAGRGPGGPWPPGVRRAGLGPGRRWRTPAVGPGSAHRTAQRP